MKIFRYIINTIFMALMLGVVGLFTLPYLPFDHGIDMRIVESGSMEPAIMTGSLIMVRSADSYAPGDVIMFESRYSDVPTTHRVVDTYEERGSVWFVTKGDANEEADSNVVPMRDVMGTVALDIPRAGFVLDFARQPTGFIFLIVLPACLIVLSEIEKIWREIRGRRQTRMDDHEDDDNDTLQSEVRAESLMAQTYQPMMDIATPARYFLWPTLDLRGVTPYRRRDRRRGVFSRGAAVSSIVGFSLLIVSANLLGSTVSYFNDIEESMDNVFAAITLDFVASADGSVFTFFDGVLTDEDGGVEVTVTPEPESVDMLHEVSVEVTGGAVALCDAVIADTNDPFVYSGALPLMSESDVVFSTPWMIDFSLGDTAALSGGESCMADIVLTAWHFDTESGDGYFDEERVPLTFNYTLPAPAFVPSVAGASLSVGLETQSDDGGINKGEEDEDANKNEQGSEVAEEKRPDDPAGGNGSAIGEENKQEGQQEALEEKVEGAESIEQNENEDEQDIGEEGGEEESEFEQKEEDEGASEEEGQQEVEQDPKAEQSTDKEDEVETE